MASMLSAWTRCKNNTFSVLYNKLRTYFFQPGAASIRTDTGKPYSETTDILKSIEFLSLLVTAACVIIVLLTTTLILAGCLWRLNCCSKVCQKKGQGNFVLTDMSS